MGDQSWTIQTRNKKLDCFDDEKEKEWSGEYFFIQGADSQFGLIRRYLMKCEKITWEEEIELCEKIVKQINKMNPKPRFFVICGDLCDAEPGTDLRAAQELDFKRIFSQVDADIPLICVCGNHDVGDTPTKDAVNRYRTSFGDDYFSFWCGGVLYLVLNSQYLYDGSQMPEETKEHDEWIDQQLLKAKTSKSQRIIIFQHIPWMVESMNDKDSYFVLSANTRNRWLPKFKDVGVEAIFCGHYHRNAFVSYQGMEIVTTSAIGAQLGQDVSGARLVKVLQNGIAHQYYGIDDLPLVATFQ